MMSKSPNRRLSPVGGRTNIEKLEIEQFARKLYDKMTEKGLSQSDLARRAFGTKLDERGYKVAKSRDRISVYLKGTSLPDPKNLALLADALDVTPEELAPDITAATVDRENPEVALTSIAGHGDKVHLQVNKLVPLTLAAEIVSMISKYDDD